MSEPKCPTCGGKMWESYESGMWGKDYYWKCSKKKKHNPNCPDKNKYYEDDKGKIILTPPSQVDKGKGEKWQSIERNQW